VANNTTVTAPKPKVVTTAPTVGNTVNGHSNYR
jgi:hypothetical protein